MNIILTAADGTVLVGVGTIANDRIAVLSASWTGPGSDRVFEWLNTLREFGARDLNVGDGRTGFHNIILTGPLPPGYTAADFAPPTLINR